MKLSEIAKIHEQKKGRTYDDPELYIVMASPSIGRRAGCGVDSAGFGFDWESGLLILTPSLRLVEKTQKEEVFDLAFDFIYTLSRQRTPKGRLGWLAQQATDILKRAKVELQQEQK